MKMKKIINMFLLAGGLSTSVAAFGQSSQNSHNATGSTPPLQLQLKSTQVGNLESYGETGLSSTALDSNNVQHNMYIMVPVKDKLKSLGPENYNAVIAPVYNLEFPNKGMYGRSEYATFVIAKDKRNQLTEELVSDWNKLKAFLEKEGNVTEIDRRLTEYQIHDLFEANKDKNPNLQKHPDTALALVAGN